MAKSRTRITFEPGGIFSRMILPAQFRKRQSETRFKQEWKMSTMQYYGMMKKQRGSIGMMAAAGTMAPTGAVVMTSGTSSHTTNGTICAAGFAWQPNGVLDEIGPIITARTLLISGEWWDLEPVTNIGSSYEVRNATGSTNWQTAAAIQGTWIQINAERIWRIQVLAHDAPASDFASSTFEVGGNGTSSADDSATLSADCQN